ncbi:MAG: hypothetical protein ACFFG0_07525 [Candidatus Thorarchaeota archaeon]
MENYHSSLKSIKPLNIKGKLHRKEYNGNIALCHDICNGSLPLEFNQCDVLYSEPAWKSGYSTFLERADKKDSTYEQYISSINKIIMEYKYNKAIWLIIGSHIIRKIVKPERILKINLHNFETNLCGWNDSNSYNFKTNYEFITLLSKKYNCVGDFCCGYGNTGYIFQINKKNFVLSDFNPKCIYYIAKTLMR